MEIQRPLSNQNNLEEKNTKIEGFILFHFKIYYKSAVIKAVWS